MILYHGSWVEVKNPDVAHSRKAVDFGPGFYVTPIYEQAKKWSDKFARKNQTAVVSQYRFDESALEKLKVIKFDSYSEEWLDFILNCRSGNIVGDYDIVIGGVANDKVFNTVELYFDGLIDKYEALSRLKYEKPNLQFCFRTQAAIDGYLKFERSVEFDGK